MLVVRGLGLGDTTATAPLTVGYCWLNGVWTWTTADKCSTPLIAGEAPLTRAGFCWTRTDPPSAFPGYWTRSSGAACTYEGPPTPPTVAAGWCQNSQTGVWEWVLATQCEQPVVADSGIISTPGGVSVTDVSDRLDPVGGTPMTISMINRLVASTWKHYTEREQILVELWTRTLAPCPAETIKPPSCLGCKPTCYSYGAITMAQTIPGTFELLGVPFNIAEPGVTESPNFERVYTPNNEQRIFIEGVIIKRSWRMLANIIADLKQKDASYNQALAALPRFAAVIPGMAWRPPAPRPEELDTKGGFYAWFNRGGFLISRDIVEGKQALYDDATCPQACLGNSCRCGDNALPACIGAFVPTTGTGDLKGGCFYWFTEVQPTGQMKLVGKHDDPTWLQKVGDKLGGWMTTIGQAYCAYAQGSGTSSATTEKCVDKDGKACVKGTAGCTCTTPSAASVGGAGLFNYIATAGKLGCRAWLAEYTQKPTDPLPPVPDPPALPPKQPTWIKLLPWILGGIAAGGIGAYASTRR